MRTIRDYQDDINSWPDGPGKQKLIDLVYRLKGRRLESSPDGTWGGTVEFAAIVKSLTTILLADVGPVRGRAPKGERDAEYEELRMSPGLIFWAPLQRARHYTEEHPTYDVQQYLEDCWDLSPKEILAELKSLADD
ncbi:unnamed protein product [Durusdinium trenchii]|uniref:Uncharacterized protein n=1 Tax=Durusdinium trenchii TaxID=1381693 RepID=A0ABP0QJX8_9DINO